MPTTSPSYVVGIGASAGGLEEIRTLFSYISNPTPFAFVVVQHLSSDHESMMDELLARHTSMPITVVDKPVQMQAGHIYLISHRHNLLVDQGQLKPAEKAKKPDLNLPIDAFFHSLADHYQEHTIAVVLSGSGTDGSRGVKAIREKGGLVLVQRPDTAKFEGMPRTAQSSGADLVLPVPEIAREINRLSTDSPARIASEVNLSDEKILTTILTLVYDRTSNDFRQHRTPTLLRRIDKRARIVRTYSLQDYYHYLTEHAEEVQCLVEEFSISVSGFFRDKPVWDTFRDTVVPELFASKATGETVRIWVPGCTTGEEPYTIAILLSEYQARHRTVDFKIFASDIDKKALARAGIGEFPESILHDVEPLWLEKYFKRTKDGYRINKNIREKVVFAAHNLISDPPFIRMDLISCRNTLIYIKPEVQQRILKNFHYSLHHRAYLILGKNGSLGEVGSAFRAVAPQTNIFQSTQEEKFDRLSSTPLLPRPVQPLSSGKPSPEKKPPVGRDSPSDYYAALLVQEHAPTAVFTDAQSNILYISGDVESILSIPQKQARLNLLDMVEKDERLLIKNGTQKAQQEKTSVHYEDVRFRKGDTVQTLNLRFKEVWQDHLKKKAILVEFIPTAAKVEDKKVAIQQDRAVSEQIEMLEREIQQKDRELQSLGEELETSNEELQASNEELQASNEELQSSNEELQSVNEELHTVNSELKQKVSEVVAYSNDIDNLLASTDIATIFLDKDLQVRTITPQIEDIINIGQKDVGRPFAHFTNRLKRNSLDKDIQKVQSSGKPVRREVETKDGTHYYNQVLPYQKGDGHTEGIVITFVNISDVKRARAARLVAEKKTKDTKNRLEMVIESVKVGIWEWTPSTDRVEWNRHMLELFDFKDDEFDHTFRAGLARIHPDDQAAVRAAFWQAKVRKERLDIEYRVVWQDQSVHYLYTQGRVITDQKTTKLVGTSVDLTERKAAEEEALQYGQLLENSHNEIYICDARTLRFINVNQGAQGNIGYSLAEMRSLTLLDIMPTLSRQQFQDLTNDLDQREEESIRFETTHQRQDGSRYPVLSNLQGTRYRDRNVYVLIVQDITEQTISTAQLQESNRQLKIANEYLDNFVFTAAHDLRAPVANLLSLVDLLNEQGEASPIVDKIGLSVERLESTLSGLIKILNIQQYGEDEAEEVDFAQVLHAITHELDPQIKEAKANVETDFRVSAICYIPPYLESIVRNLVSNAVKYRSADRPLRVVVRTEQSSGLVALRISDNGIGINLNRFKDRLFKPFERLTRQANGKGIGMHLVKTMVEKNGGYLEVASQLNQGTTFTAYLKPYESA